MSRRPSRTEQLAQLRREIESIDRSVVLLIAARLHVAQRTIQLRTGSSRRLTDPTQERRVIERGREWAREAGISEELVTRLFRTLMEEGKAKFRTAEKIADAPFVTVLLEAPAGLSVVPDHAPGPRSNSTPSVR